MSAEPDVTFLLNHAAHVLRTRMAVALAEAGLTARMHCVLTHATGAERTQAELAELGDMDKTTMVVTVDALERAGLAERRASARDRRARIVSVTDRGAALAARSTRIADRVHQEVLDTLPPGEREVFLRAMRRLVDGPLATPVEAPAPARRPRQSGQ